MCDACDAKGINWSLSNGDKKSGLSRVRFYRAFDGRTVNVTLCYLCSIHLFTSGELNFLVRNPSLKKSIIMGDGPVEDFGY